MAERGIGRGLAAILPPPQQREESLHRVPLNLIDPNPRQPRTNFPDRELRELVDQLLEICHFSVSYIGFDVEYFQCLYAASLFA